jgi:hypothetical protein
MTEENVDTFSAADEGLAIPAEVLFSCMTAQETM